MGSHRDGRGSDPSRARKAVKKILWGGQSWPQLAFSRLRAA